MSGSSRPRIGVISLGCAKNLVDTEVMLGHLGRHDVEFVRDPKDADVIIVNTCSFIAPAREESVRAILEAAEYKTHGRLKRLIVAGCMVQRYADELRDSLPEVDAFVGLDELDQIVPAILADEPAPPVAQRWSEATYLYDAATPRRLATPAWTAYVKIAEGCDHTCSFCAIPSFRGRFRSRPIPDVVAEARRLSEGGVREINLIAQDSSHYGRDHGLKEGLSELLVALDQVEALRWIRVHYLYPNTITPRLIETMATTERVVPYVDLPLQHAHPETLKRMRRGGSGQTHLRLLERFRSAIPGVALRSTFIVGFPGETEAEFRALLEFVRAAEFDHLGVFTYSHEEGTTALEQPDDVSESSKSDRRERLMAEQQSIAFSHAKSWVGRTVEGVVEGAHPETEHLLVGRTARQAADVDGQVLINDGIADPGSFVRLEITETAGYDLVGRIAAPV